MDTEELIRKCKAITIKEEDKSKVSLGVNMKEQRRQVLAGCLMGKVLLSRGVNREGLKVSLQQVWRTFKEVKIESLGNNIFMFKFAEETDKRRVLSGGPWHFDRALIVLTEPKGIGEVSKQVFTHVPFWVQIRNIPTACMERDFLQELGGMIGNVDEIESDENGDCFGEFAKIRIFINLTHPLKKILFLKQEGKTDIPMPVVYERLPDFCFCCGIIGHQFKECAQYQGQPKGYLSFGMWMKALMIGGRSRKYRGKERWQNGGERIEKSTSSKFHDKSQQLQQEQVKPADKNGLGSGEEEMGQTKEIDRTSEVEWVGEQHLMKNVTEMMATKQDDGEMQGESTGNVTVLRDLRINARNVNSTEGEKMEVVRAEKHKENLGSNAAQEGVEETKIYTEAGSSQTKINKKKWKRQARATKNEGVVSSGLRNLKRPSSEAAWPNSKLKKTKVDDPSHSEMKKLSLIAEQTEVHWELLVTEEMELTASSLEEISAGAGSQPRRKP
ncbi:hypothetical protein AB3S75_022854 [Citrus x aurantiifolia]